MGRKFFVFVIGIFMLASVFGLGVTPARTTLDFEPGLSRAVNFEVSADGSSDVRLVFSVQGGLAEYVTLSEKEGFIGKGEGSKTFSFDLNLPSKMEPGVNTGEIVVLQLPVEGASSGSQIIATLAVVTQIHLYVPYPGKYANAKMYIYPNGKGEPVRFVIPVVSAGEFDLVSVRANVDIYTKGGEKVDSFDIDSISIPSGKKKELVYDWDADVPVGDYLARASLIYDEGTVDLEEEFSFGSEELVLEEINVRDFSLGDIARLEMLVENKWSENVDDVYIDTVISDNSGNIVSNFKSSDYSVPAFSKENFVSYWDTAGVRTGSYEALISINYGDKSSQKDLVFEVSENELVVVGLGYVISGREGGNSNTLVFVLLIVIGILVLINILWFMVLRKKLKS